MTRSLPATVLPVLALLALAACSEPRLIPVPGQAPDWPASSPPRPSYAPLPFTTNYAPSAPVQTLPAVPQGQNVPYAVPASAAPAAAAAAEAKVTWDPANGPDCHKVPTVTVDGKPASVVCKGADGLWSYVPD